MDAAQAAIIAFGLLTAPAEAYSPVPAGSDLTVLGEAVKTVAVEMEVFDRREWTAFCVDPTLWDSDLAILKRRVIDLKDAPHCWEETRFPFTRTDANAFMAFNRRHKEVRLWQYALEPSRLADAEAAAAECDRLYGAWDALRDSIGDYNHVSFRRERLKTLKMLIGPERWSRGEMPPCIPTWRLEEK
jgi:hypothetical protein